MQELSREQESAIARLAIDHPSVAVAPQEDGTVKVTADGRTMILNEDGGLVPVGVKSVPIRLPIGLLRRLLGDECVDGELAKVEEDSYPDYGMGMRLSDAVATAIGEALDAARATGVR